MDIDLTYLPTADRAQALTEIDAALKRIGGRIRKMDATIHIIESAPQTQETINKLVIRTRDRTQIKIELSPVMRECVFDPITMRVSEPVEDEYGFAEIKVLSFADLYAGKIMAALDRQHPRDLFDVHLLLSNEGINEDLREAIIVYLISHDSPPHTMLAPRLKDISQEYENNFLGMTQEEALLDLLLAERQSLIDNVVENMSDAHKKFLASFYSRTPTWSLLNNSDAQYLPAVRWKELNLDKAGEEIREKLIVNLKEVFGN